MRDLENITTLTSEEETKRQYDFIERAKELAELYGMSVDDIKWSLED